MTVNRARLHPGQHQDVDVHSSLPTTVNIVLKVASETTTVVVQAEGAQVETDPSTHQDVDRNYIFEAAQFRSGRRAESGHHL